MKFAFGEYNQIDAGGYAQLYERFTPLTAAIRELAQASLRTDVDSDTLRTATKTLEALTRTLQAEQRPRPDRQTRHVDTGRAVVWSNPVTGPRNPIAPPLHVHHESDGRCWSEFTLGEIYEGPPGMVHGGVVSMVLDQVLGEVASDGMRLPRFTGTLTVKYVRGTPLGQLRVDAWVDRDENHKTHVRGHISDAHGPTAEAEGIFITPAWAREQESGGR